MLELFAQIQITKRTGGGCVADDGFCPDWIVHNLDKYWTPLLEHIFLTLVSLVVGVLIAFALALLAHRKRWLTGPIVGFTGALYTVPSIAAFFLLLPITGRGNLTAIVALVIDERNHPVRWLLERDMRGDKVPVGEPAHELITVELDDVMRDALGYLLDAETLYAPVLDDSGCVQGILSMAVISQALHLPAEDAHSSSDLVELAD